MSWCVCFLFFWFCLSRVCPFLFACRWRSLGDQPKRIFSRLSGVGVGLVWGVCGGGGWVGWRVWLFLGLLSVDLSSSSSLPPCVRVEVAGGD